MGSSITTHKSENILYVIGKNIDGQLGLKHGKKVNKLSNFNSINPNLTINHIHNGYGHTIFIDSNGNQWVSGSNAYGQCGINKADEYILKCTKIENNNKMKKICVSVCGLNTFWITNKNEVYGAGSNEQCQMGLIDRNNPIKPKMIAALKNVITVKSGKYHSMAICVNIPDIIEIIRYWIKMDIPNDIYSIIKSYYLPPKYRVYSTGDYCYCGADGHGSNRMDKRKWNIIAALKDEHIINVSCGNSHTLFLSESGTIWSCGDKRGGALGIGPFQSDNSGHSMFQRDRPKPIPFFNCSKTKIIITKIECGHSHNLCVDINGALYSFGWNNYGQCGVGREGNVFSPQLILSDTRIIDIDCGVFHSYTKSQHDEHFLFGRNNVNQCSLEPSDRTNILAPICINDTVSKITRGKRISNVYLGDSNTFLIVS